MPEEQQEKFHQASSYEHVCPLRGVSAIVRSAVWKTNNSKGSLNHHFMNTSAAAWCVSAFFRCILPSYCLVRGHLLFITAWGRSLAATRPATLRLSYCLVRGHLPPITAWGRSLAATRPATLRVSYYLVRGHLLPTSAWMFSRSYIIRQFLTCRVPVNDIGGF